MLPTCARAWHNCVVAAAVESATQSGDALGLYLEETKALVVDEIRRLVPADDPNTGGLYELMLDYPLRGGKGLRPALCIATCRALGGSLAGVLPTAAVLELYHNAFLVHDDVEDGSEKRRQQDTLHRLHGVPIAVNVGDGMLALALRPLLDNMETLGMGRALRLLLEVSQMSQQSAEGQMLELDWVRRVKWRLGDREYVRMVHKKSAWYSFVTPVAAGAIAAGAGERLAGRLRRFATLLGVAFQIQDDVLNLAGEEIRYGKEIGGDLWEGKHTLILIHALRNASPRERARAMRILGRDREGRGAEDRLRRRVLRVVDRLEARGGADAASLRSLRRALGGSRKAARTRADVRFLQALIGRHGSIDYAWQQARRRSLRAARAFKALCEEIPPSPHRAFLEDVIDYVVSRDR